MAVTLIPAGMRPDPKSMKILAKSIFKELKTNGYTPKQVISLATELISLVTTDLAAEHVHLADGTGVHRAQNAEAGEIPQE